MTRHGPRGEPSRTARSVAMLLAATLLFAANAAVRAQEAPAPPAAPKFDATRNITVSTRNMDLAAFLELLSVSYKLNIVSPKDITGKVSVNFYDVPPLDALAAVLEANGYQYVIGKTAGRPIIRIQTIPKIEGEVPLVMRTFHLSYATADNVTKAAQSLLSKNGSITVAGSTNAFVVQDVAERVERVAELVKALDEAPRQVMIDAKLVEISETDLEELGFNWSMFQNMNIADITAEASYARAATWVDTKVTGSPDTNTRDIVTTTGTNVDLRAGILSENNAQLMLDFFDTLTNTRVVSRPSIRTIDNKAAHILSGQIVPIPLYDFAKDTGVRTLSGFQDEQIGVELTVTPHINKDGYITLDVVPQVQSIARWITVDGDEQRPVTNTRLAETTIRIKDGNTAVIGGLTQASTNVTRTGLPFLKDLPLVGWFFSNKTTTVINSELVIFITPRIVDAEKEPMTKGQKRVNEETDKAGIIK
jgi:type IV pilus assembly protein PilQ